MFSYGGQQIVGYGLVAFVVTGTFILPVALRFQWGRSPCGLIRVYRTLPWVRLFIGAVGLWRLVVPWLTEGNPGDAWIYNAYLIIFGALLGLPLLGFASQRYEMRLDMRQHTYRLIQGWLLHTRIKSGTWEDFAGVFVKVGSGQIYSVGLTWKNEGGCHILRRCYDSAKAELLAAEVENAMDIPRVSAPEGNGVIIL